MSGDSVSDDMLRSFYERWQRLEEMKHEWDARRPHYAEAMRRVRKSTQYVSTRAPGPSPRLVAAGNGITAESAAEMLRLCAWLTRIGRAGEYQPEDRRGYMIACRLTGLSWNDIQKAIGDVSQVGAESAGIMWSPHMAQPDLRFVGFIYSAFVERHPEVVKIGFSRKPEARMKSLSRYHGEPITLGACIPGTMLHEWAIHQIIFRAVTPEWYRTTDVPDWLMPIQFRARAA